MAVGLTYTNKIARERERERGLAARGSKREMKLSLMAKHRLMKQLARASNS